MSNPMARARTPRADKRAASRPAPLPGPPLWLFLTEPGLGQLLSNELKFIGAVARKAQFARLNLRNHDLLVLPDIVMRERKSSPRLATNVLSAPVFGRGEVSARGYDLLAQAFRRERADGIVKSVAGEQFAGADVLPRILRELGRRGVRLHEEVKRPAWFLAVDDKFYFGFPRFNHHEVAGRANAREREGSLPAVIAAAMVFAAKPGTGEVIFDPVMGTGTILAEAAQMAPGATLLGSDIDPVAVAIARKRLAHTHATLFRADSTRVELNAPPLTLVIANLPFGKRFKPERGTRAFYEAVLRRVLDHAAPTWRAILLTSDAEALEAAVQAIGLSASRIADVKVRGEVATIWQVRKPQ